ncbi:MAG TPA: sugar-binding protein [Chthonomonadaceae bacterium]|nr:sugar-binding protein [Chthonomonadaceae bacterium]
MKPRYCLLGGIAAIVAAAALAGCDPNKNQPAANGQPGTSGPATSAGQQPPTAPPAGAGTYKVITNGISPFWDSMGKGLDAAKGQLKCNADWQAPNPADNNEQVKLFKTAVAAKVDGIAVSVIEAKAMAPVIDDAIQQGIPVITFDSDSPDSKRYAYIGTNNYEAGKIAGQETVKLFPNGGKLVAFVGNMGAQNAQERYNGMKDAVKGHNIEFLQEPFEDNKDKGKARKNVEDAITRYQAKGLTGLVGLYSYNGPTIVSAVQAQGLRSKIKIICFDGEPETLNNLSKGLVDVTVVQKPYEFGRLSVLLLDALKKENKDIDKAIGDIKPELDKQQMKVDTSKHVIDTGVDVITPANAAPFLKSLKDRGLSST